MRKTLFIFLLLFAYRADAQTWSTVGTMLNCTGAPTGEYTQTTGSYPCFRSQTPMVYNNTEGKPMIWLADGAATATEPEWGNNVYLYDPSQGTAVASFSPLWNSLNEATSNGTITAISHSSGVVTFSVSTAISQTGARSLQVGDWVKLVNVTGDTSVNGLWQITSVSNCNANNLVCSTFTANVAGSGLPNVSGNVQGPAPRYSNLGSCPNLPCGPVGPLPKHQGIFVYDTTRNALWQWGGDCDTNASAGTPVAGSAVLGNGYIVGLHGGCFELMEATKSAGFWSWTMVHGFGTTPFTVQNTSGGTITENALVCSSTTSNSGNCGWKWSYGGYDPVNDVVVMFGGSWNGTGRNETYEFQPCPSSVRPSCTGDVVVVQCGAQATCSSNPPARQAFADAKIVPIGNGPNGCTGAQAGTGGRMFLFGGQASGAPIGDTWIYDTTHHLWCKPASANTGAQPQANGTVPANCPSCGSGTLAGTALYDWDPIAGIVVLVDTHAPAQVWFFDVTSFTWTLKSVSGTAPTITYTSQLLPEIVGVFDPNTNGGATPGGQMIMFTCPSGTSCGGSNILVSSLALPATTSIAYQTPIAVQADEWPNSVKPTTRTNGVVSVAFPIPDAFAVTCTGCTAGIPASATSPMLSVMNSSNVAQPAQFRVMSLWPSGNVQMARATFQYASLTEPTPFDTSLQMTVVTSGGGNVGSAMGVTCTAAGTPLNGCSASGDLCVNTTAAVFCVKPGADDLLHAVTQNSINLVCFTGETGGCTTGHAANDGMFLQGPSSAIAQTNIWSVQCSNAPSFPAPNASAQSCNTSSGSSGSTGGTVYLSSNDTGSTCSFLDNGPIMTVIDCIGNLDGTAGGTTYLHWEKICTFYASHTDGSCDVALRNADFSLTANSFGSSYQGLQSWESRLTLNLASGTRNLTFGTPLGATQTTTLASGTSTDNAYLYQGYSNLDEYTDWHTTNCTSQGDKCVVSPILRVNSSGTYTCGPFSSWYYAQCGYQVNKNNATLTSGNNPPSGTITDSGVPPGWAMECDASSSCVVIGIRNFGSSPGPGSIGFWTGGNEARFGLLPDQYLFLPNPTSPASYIQPWTWRNIRTIYFNFSGASALTASQASDGFLGAQEPLIARLSLANYNNATSTTTGDSMFMTPVTDPVQEETYWQVAGHPFTPGGCTPGSCLNDINITGNGQGTTPMASFPFYLWSNGGPNQMDAAWSYYLQWLTFGCTPSSGVCGAMAITGSQPGKYEWTRRFYRQQTGSGSIPLAEFICTGSGAPVAACTTAGQIVYGWRYACPSSPCVNQLTAYGYPDASAMTSWNGGMRAHEDTGNGEDHLHTEFVCVWGLMEGDPWILKQCDNGGNADIALNTTIGYNNPADLPAGNNPGHAPFSVVRAGAHWTGTAAMEALYGCSRRLAAFWTGSACQTSALAGMESAMTYAFAAPNIASGYPATNWLGQATWVETSSPAGACTENATGYPNSFVSLCTGGQNPIRGFVALGANSNGSTDNCSTPVTPTIPCDGNQHWVVKGFMTQSSEYDLWLANIAERSYRGVHWSVNETIANDGPQTNVGVTLSDEWAQQAISGMGEWTITEDLADTSGAIAGTTLNVYQTYPHFMNNTPPCYQTSGAPDCNRIYNTAGQFAFNGENYFHYFAVGNQWGVTTDALYASTATPWQQRYERVMKHMGTGSATEWLSPEMRASDSLIFAHNPNANSYPVAANVVTLAEIPITVTPLGGNQYQILWNTPATVGSNLGSTYRLVYYPYPTSGGTARTILNWLTFYPNCNSTSGDAGVCPAGGFDAIDGTGMWGPGQSPVTHWPWFSSIPVNDPALQTPTCTTTCTYTFTGQTGTSYSFDLKAYVPLSGGGSSLGGNSKITSGVAIH